MEKKEFITTLERMVDFYSDNENILPYGYIENAIERWAKAHPLKTRQREFLKLYPNARKDNNGYIDVCPCALDADLGCRGYKCCGDCRRDYWGAEC